MKFGWDMKKDLDRQPDEERLKELRREKRISREKDSQELLRQKYSDDRENRPVMTGFKPLKKEEPSLRETMRMENSRGILALGGDERKWPALVVTEKAHPHGTAGTERERNLQEMGKRDYPAGQNRTMINAGERDRGAVGFLLRPALTRTQMIEHMKRYMDEHDQKTLGRMMPFMVTDKELAYKRELEETVQENRRAGQEKTAKMLDCLLAEKKEELIRKRQMETLFGQKLEKAMREEKKTVWEDFSDLEMERRKRNASDTDNPSDNPADEEEAPEQSLPEGAGKNM